MVMLLEPGLLVPPVGDDHLSPSRITLAPYLLHILLEDDEWVCPRSCYELKVAS